MTEQQYRFRSRYLDCSNLTIEEAQDLGEWFAQIQRDINFYCGDLARYAESRWPETHQQIWPEWVSSDMLSRCAGVCRAYPTEEERQHQATYTQYMQKSGKPNRQALLAEIVDRGLTTDESRKPLTPSEPATKGRWLLAVDVNYYLHRFWYSGSGVESASNVAEWIERTVERLKLKGLTDVACCFDAPYNHRKELTKEWVDEKYKDRPPKPPELIQQLQVVRQLLEGKNFACVSIETMEADDVMASYAKQFDGKVTIMTQDKDCRQCLSEKCNMLTDVEWSVDETSGEQIPDYKWVTAKSHVEDTGIRADQWIDYQSIMGDNVDGIKGAAGIGEKGAKDLIVWFGSCEAAIQAARDNDARIKPKKRDALIEFAAKLEITRQLVTLRDDLQVTTGTRI
jgi:5'-3' exonuclease